MLPCPGCPHERSIVKIIDAKPGFVKFGIHEGDQHTAAQRLDRRRNAVDERSVNFGRLYFFELLRLVEREILVA